MAKGKSKAATGPKDSSLSGEAGPASGLSSFLLGQAPAKDDALDDIFAHSKGPSLAFQPKSKTTAQPGSTRVDAPAAAATSDEGGDGEQDDDEADEVLSELDSDAELSDENEADLEEAYAARIAAAKAKAHQATITSKKRKAPSDEDEEDEDEEAEVDSDDEDEDQTEKVEDDGKMDLDDLIQGALAEDEPTTKSTKAGKKQSEDKGKKSAKLLKREQETPEERDARTVFLGNIPADCSTSRPLKKALVRHVLQNPALQSSLPEGCPPLKLDSIRFRSIAFASKVFGRKATSTGEAGGEDAGGRSRKRAKEWREAEGSDIRGVRGGFRAREDDDAAGPSRSSNGRVQPLTDAQKRKVALIRGELNDGKKACNAYLVIAALPESVDARAVVRAVVEAANNSVFEGFTIHADHVRPRSAAALLAAAQMAAKPNENLTDVPRNSDGFQVAPADARRTVFIGGLDFAESEENVRAAVEACLVRERGEVPADERYVQNVRVVRDPSSGLGKGFCYVLLQDDSCVDELLALPPGKYLKISRRKVRLERCKTAAAAARAKASARTVAGLPPRSATAAGNGSNAPGAAGSRPRPVRLAAPQDPTAAKHHHNPPSKAAHQAELAEALAKLPPSERKAVKSLDAERIARRAQKKEQKRLAERYERKQANLGKKAGGGGAEAILGKESRAAERHRKEKKRIEKQSKSSVKKKK
ncbi:hypothetical protein C6P46_002610 [Rhodotorula mucilaginosa]|uniref:Nucleolar protein 12 n=1 Tax=Rhodotorula mucilaginosa TaxID=5537 RepID=A0A9P6WAG7_RHOMI|nr:hypothetical protein C6P46_002610 [Rhodotorula mucilaginosa]